MSAPGPNSLIDRVDDDDIPLGQMPRRDAPFSGGAFRTVHVFLVNHRGELLLQRLATGRERHPLRWGSSVAAYLHAGEDYEEGASRRLCEELGVRASLGLVGKIRFQETRAEKFVTLFVARGDEAEIADRDHIDELQWWALDTLSAAVADDSEAFTPTFVALYRSFRDVLESPPDAT